MISCKFENGQGLGNQLWVYATTASVAKLLGYDLGIINKYLFKGRNFITLFGNEIDNGTLLNIYTEQLIRNANGIDITPTDHNIFYIDDNTTLLGNLQSYNYVKRFKNYLMNCINIDIKTICDSDLCLIHYRGGDYINSPSNSALTRRYYNNAISEMINRGCDKFAVVTDDYQSAKRLFPEFDIIGSCNYPEDKLKASHHLGGDISIDFSLLNTAKNVIMSNSTFAWWAVWLNKKVENVIAPYGWFAHNLDGDFWSVGDMYMPEWLWLDKYGNFR